MFNRLGRGNQTGVERGHALEVRHDFSALLGDPHDSFAGFRLPLLADNLENALKTLHLAAGLSLVFDESGLEILWIARPWPFWAAS
jgi:hypothetical protein